MRPTEILSGEHRVIEQVLACLEKMADRAAERGTIDRPAAGQALDFFRTFADQCHHRKEEAHLFPLLETRGFEREQGPTGVMLDEHEQGRRHLEGLAAAVWDGAAGPFVHHARAYVRLLREHIRKEDLCLFPMADRALSAADQQTLLAAFDDVENHGLHADTHRRFLQLADELAERCGVPRDPAIAPGGHGGCCCGHHAAARA
jgi:hemerythrin-like domain-containing protein